MSNATVRNPVAVVLNVLLFQRHGSRHKYIDSIFFIRWDQSLRCRRIMSCTTELSGSKSDTYIPVSKKFIPDRSE
ncbi:hypothetical protein AYX13_03012 [Cryptococcus neoformans]|nr:hypothetical protein AYX13_03012 [Cryptococcus neoformans var. grubii]